MALLIGGDGIMQTFADRLKVQVAPTRSAGFGVWKAPQKTDWKPHSVGRDSSGFDFNFARIPIHAPKRAYDQPVDSKGMQTKKVKELERVPTPVSEELEGAGNEIEGERGGGEGVAETQEMKVASGIGLNFKQKKMEETPGVVAGKKKDKVASGVTLGSLSQPDGGKVDADSFGTETYDADFNNVTHSFAKKVCTISGALDVTCQWGTRRRGRTDVPSGTSPVVTATNWPDIKKDLTPDKNSPYKSPRKEYYSQDLTERHEIYHGADDYGRTKSTGMGLVKASLEKNTVTPKNVDKKLPKMLKDAKAAVVKDVKDYYEGTGTDHDSYAGEIRAYLKGKPHYEALADSVEKHGKTLRIPRQTKRRP
jgi:hypothetical protein